MSVYLVLSQASDNTVRPQARASASSGVSVYTPAFAAFAGTHSMYPQRDGQAK